MVPDKDAFHILILSSTLQPKLIVCKPEVIVLQVLDYRLSLVKRWPIVSFSSQRRQCCALGCSNKLSGMLPAFKAQNLPHSESVGDVDSASSESFQSHHCDLYKDNALQDLLGASKETSMHYPSLLI